MRKTSKRKQYKRGKRLFSGEHTAASTEAAAIPDMNVVVTQDQLGKRLLMHNSPLSSDVSVSDNVQRRAKNAKTADAASTSVLRVHRLCVCVCVCVRVCVCMCVQAVSVFFCVAGSI